MSTVTADLTVSFNIQDTETSGTLNPAGFTINDAESTKLLYNGTSPNTAITKRWAQAFTFAVSTPQTLDLTALTPGPNGSTVTFATVVAIYFYNTGAHPVVIGNAATPFTPGWGDPTHVETVNTNSRYVKENNGTAWVVDSTHKLLQFDPGAFTGTGRLLIIGN